MLSRMDLLYVQKTLAKLERMSRQEREALEGFANIKPLLYKLAYVAETRRKLTKRNKAKTKRLQRDLKWLRQQVPKAKRRMPRKPKQIPNASHKKCYMCRQPHALFRTEQEAKICPSCVKLNDTMRTRMLDLTRKHVLITGGRVKVGYHTALACLRAGADVMITTRFPKDALLRYRAEKDATTWLKRLCIVAADFTRMVDIERLIASVKQWTLRLDIVINNAAQTIRRPQAFYRTLLQQESQPLLQHAPATTDQTIVAYRTPTSVGIPMALDAAYAQDTQTFPPGKVDGDGQQLDLRKENTWTQGIRDTDTMECAETMLINSIAPFHLIKALLPRMKHAKNEGYGWIMNITSAEGRFDKQQGKSKHPHNNMSKAALNMLTKTIATDVVRDRIIITSIDIGWVNNMGPGDQLGNGMALLSYKDAVARVLHPLGESNPRAFNGNLVRHYVIREVW